MQGQEKEAMIILKINTTSNPFASVNTLVKKKWVVQLLLASMNLGFGIGLFYFGMFLGIKGVGFNIYLTSTFNSLLSLSPYLPAFLFWIQKVQPKELHTQVLHH